MTRRTNGEPGLATFGPDETCGGGTTGNSAPSLEVALNGPATEDTFVTITSPSPELLDVVGGGVTIPVGAYKAEVILQAGSGGADVVLTASYDGVQLAQTVTVLSASEVPTPKALEPSEILLPVDSEMAVRVILDLPASSSGQRPVSVDSDLISAPESVTVPAGAFEATSPSCLALRVGRQR